MKTHKILPLLTAVQLEIINGSLMGDGSLSHVKNTACNWKLTKGQSLYDKDGISKQTYMQWHFDNLLPYSSKLSIRSVYKKLVNTSKGILNVPCETPYQSYDFNTCSHPIWTDLAKKWYVWNDGNPILKNNRIIKIVPNDLKLTALTLCVWFMDDGFLYPRNGNAVLCTHCFTLDECNFLVELLNKNLSIKSKVRTDSRTHQPFIFIGVKSYHDLIGIIKPYVAWECFKYKLDNSYSKIHQSGENHSQAKVTEEDVEEMVQLRLSGIAIKKIASKFNVSEACVSLNTTRRWKHQTTKITFIKKPRLTQEQKQHVLTLLKKGMPQKEIAISLNINQSTVSRILCKSCMNKKISSMVL